MVDVVRVGLIDYGVGNLGSVVNALRRVGAEALVVSKASELKSVDALVLPGVGSFDSAMKNLMGMVDELNNVKGSIPILGICLGLQLMFRGSDEGVMSGLGWYDEWVSRISGPRIPHIGWDLVKVRGHCSLEVMDGYYYFMHSYAVVNPRQSGAYVGFTKYGDSSILSVLCDDRNATFGTQFHPEKSSRLGLGVFRSFVMHARR